MAIASDTSINSRSCSLLRDGDSRTLSELLGIAIDHGCLGRPRQVHKTIRPNKPLPGSLLRRQNCPRVGTVPTGRHADVGTARCRVTGCGA